MKHVFTLSLCFLFTSTLFAQVVLERDINLEAASSRPSSLTELNGALYFRADDGVHGEELYKYDLTTGVAELVVNLRPYEEHGGIREIVAFDNKIYFDARYGNGINYYLHVYDPADNSVQRLSDSEGTEVNDPTNFFVFEEQLYFAADFSGIGIELGRYDPLTNKVDTIADIHPNGNGHPNFFNEVNGQLWFLANDGQSNSRLWRYDPGTGMVENINYNSPNAIYPSMNFLHYFDGKFYFRGHTQSTGEELFVYDLASNTLLDIPEVYPGIASSSPYGFRELDGKLYFAARNLANGREMRVYDPTTGEVSLVDEINPNGDADPGDILVLNDKIYFTASTDETQRNLYSYATGDTNVTFEGTLENNGGPNYLSPVIVADGSLFLTGNQLAYGQELYRFSPGNGIELAADINTTTVGSDPYQFTPYNGKLYFGADEVNSGREIWVYNPETGNVDILSDEPGSIRPAGFTVLDGKLFFSGIDPNEGYGLLYYDDATGQVNPTSFITPNHIGHITDITAYNNLLYFSANDEVAGQELFSYDPATDEFGVVADIHPTADAHPENLFVFEGDLYFEANDGEFGTELWKYNDSTGEATMVEDINPGEDSSNPAWFAVYDGELYFSAFVQDLAYDIYSYNPTTGMVTQHTDINNNLNPLYLTVYRDKLFFSGRYSAAVNAELVYYDAATGETVLTEDLAPSASSPSYLTVFNDKLYFATFTEDYGRELWEYNDTTLAIVADIRPGVPDSDPTYLTLFNDKLYFSANDGLRGAEIWSIAECLNIFVDTQPQIGPDGMGSIDLSITGGLPPYTIIWSNGATTEDIENLEPGVYTVTVSDASGCLSEVTAEVTFVSGTETVLPAESVSLFPNPSAGSFSLEVGELEVEMVEVFDLKGGLLYQKMVGGNQPIINVHLRYVQTGVYVVKVNTADGVVRKRVVVE